jgi:serine/threonine protein kinase
MHNCRIEHGDIKPHNILLREDLTIAVSDFGGAKRDVSEVLRRTLTTVYACPSRRFAYLASPSDMVCDMYSFGVTAFALLTQESPDSSFQKPGTMNDQYMQYLLSRTHDTVSDNNFLKRLLEDVILPCTCLREGGFSLSRSLSSTSEYSNQDIHPNFDRFEVTPWLAPRKASSEMLEVLNRFIGEFAVNWNIDEDKEYFRSICHKHV